jgi:hypothetical protein
LDRQREQDGGDYDGSGEEMVAHRMSPSFTETGRNSREASGDDDQNYRRPQTDFGDAV